VSLDEAAKMLRSAPCKQCALDPAPTWLIKRLAGTIVPVIAAMCNASFAQEHLPVFHNFALIRSLLKKPTMYPNDLCSYCPISNLNFISKLVEQVVDMRFIEHADRYQLLAINQSAYRLYRSTETANVSVVHNDMLSSINKGYVGALVLLDMSAAFDTVDRAILVNVLQRQLNTASKTGRSACGLGPNCIPESKPLQISKAAHKCITIGSAIIEPSLVVRDLGVFFDAELTMHDHVMRVAQTCFYHLRRLRSVRKQLGQETAAQLVSALILTRIDYCNATLAGLPASALQPLRRVMNAAARLVLGLKPRDHVTTALKQLHWLPIEARIKYKLCLLVHLAINGRAPVYLADLLKTVASLPSRSSLRSAHHGDLHVPAARLRLGERAFSVSGPKAFNNLPTELKTCTNTDIFKKDSKLFYLTMLTTFLCNL
jgi:hypothetical protein